MNRVVIVTSYASDELILHYKDSILIGVEKGIKNILKLGLFPSFSVSDFDTLNYEDIKDKIDSNNIKILPSEKDYSDTEESIILSKEKYNPDEIVILCSLEKRYDHSHSLLLLLKKYSEYNIKLVDDYNLIKVYEKGTYILSNYNYSYLGIFGFPKGKVSLKGVKYEVCDYELDFIETKAISNEFSDLEARLDVSKGSILLVLSKDK